MDERRRRDPLRRRSPRTRCSAAPTSAPGSGISSPAAPSAATRPRALDRPLDRPGVGGEPRLADLRLVVLWTGFSEAFASITLTLFVPLTLAALGIVLRGASFAFRKGSSARRSNACFGAIFAVSSVLVPYCMGAVAGAIASGRVPAGGEAGDPWSIVGQPDVDPRRRARGHRLRVPRGRVPRVGRAAPRATRDGRVLPPARGRRGRRRRRRRVRRDLRVARRRRRTCSTG